MSADQERVRTLLTETIILLCKNGLHFKNEFTVEGLIGITIDKSDVFLINIKETIKLNNQIPCSSDNLHSRKQISRKRKHGNRNSLNIHILESDVSDNEHININTSCDDLSSSKYLSNSSNSPLDASVHKINPSQSMAHQRLECSNSNVDDLTLHNAHNSNILNRSSSQRMFQRMDDFEDLKCMDVKSFGSKEQNLLEHRTDEHGGQPPDKSKPASDLNFMNPRDDCTSNLFPSRVKEEFHEEIDHREMATSPNSAANQKNYRVEDDQSSFARRNYSLVDGSVIAYPSHDLHSFQLYHDIEQNDQQQVELLPGSGVYISTRALLHLNKETWNRGSKLVRRVVREVFPDEHILARSSCLGRRLGGCHVGLDHHKVDTIKAFVQQRMPQVSHTEIVAAINECCRDIRAKLRKSYFRSANNSMTKQV